MKPFERRPLCGGDVVEKEVEKILRGGNHTAIVKARAEVRLHCVNRWDNPLTTNNIAGKNFFYYSEISD